jgi:hypothetical protein
MAAEDIRLLRSAVLLQRFSLQELADHAGTNRNTASSWLKRHREALTTDRVQPAVSAERGRPRKIWHLQPDGAAAFRQQLQNLTIPETVENQIAKEPLHIDRIEQLLDRVREARRTGDVEAEHVEQSAARLRVRLAWEAYAEMEAARFSVSRRRLYRLAELERDLELGTLWQQDSLPAVATWIARRLTDMTRRGNPQDFSARVLRLRTEVRELSQRVRLTAATCAALVWADESIAEAAEAGAPDLTVCACVVDQVPLSDRTDEVSRAIDPASSLTYNTDPEQRQAILLGLAGNQRHQPATQNPYVANWLLTLPYRTVWADELAPAVTYGAIDAPQIEARKVFELIGSSLRNVLSRPTLSRGQIGRLRSEAHSHGRIFASRFGEATIEAGSTDAWKSAAAYFGRGY